MPQELFINPLSAEVQEIISNRPNWITRHGMLLLLLVMGAMAGVCYFIRYPDIVATTARLTSINAPKPVVAVNGGQLVKLLVSEGQVVKMNDAVGYMKSSASHAVILLLQARLATISDVIIHNQTEKLESLFDGYLSPDSLGELQQPYQTFSQALLTFKSYLSHGFYPRKKNMLFSDRQYLEQLLANLEQQKTFQTEDVHLSETTFAANESLKHDKVISEFDYRNEKSKLIGKQLSLPQINASIIGNKSQQHDKEKEIVELENQIAQQKAIFIQAVNTLQSQAEEWCHKYILTAPVDGKVSFATFLQENQQLTSNQTICYINPENSSYFAEMTIPQANFGKIAAGQKVLLKFPAYPSQEFGAVQGTIGFISRIPTDSGYAAKVMLPAGLITNFKKQIQFREGLTASGEIITKDMRLLERFYYSIVGKMTN
ncbi:MAG: HlyD family efflux transporter periplasmic adaptor subunit [Chitinophagaceae bacterium]